MQSGFPHFQYEALQVSKRQEDGTTVFPCFEDIRYASTVSETIVAYQSCQYS